MTLIIWCIIDATLDVNTSVALKEKKTFIDLSTILIRLVILFILFTRLLVILHQCNSLCELVCGALSSLLALRSRGRSSAVQTNHSAVGVGAVGDSE